MENSKLNREDGYKYIIYFRKAKKLYKNCVEKDLKKYDLTQNEIEIIMYINRTTNQNTAKDLVKYLGLSKGMISRTIDQLISKEILQIEKDKSDKRVSRLNINPTCTELISDLEKSRTKFLGALANNIEVEKLDIFASVLEDMIDNLKELEK